MATVNTQCNRAAVTAKRPGRPARPPSIRNCAIDERALMRLVNESICKRCEFRLAQIDQLLFGNKIIDV